MGYLEERARLNGKVAAVIGGGAGVGAAVTAALASSGVDLAVCDIRDAELAATVDAAVALGRRVRSTVTDAWEPSSLDAFFVAAEEEFGQLDIVVNVVGGGVRQRDFTATTPEQWTADLHRNIGWAIQSISRAVPLIRATGRGGSIINFTTIEVFRACPQVAVYTAAKAGLTSLTRSLAAELGPDHIRVNCIAPDATPRASSGSSLSPEAYAVSGYDQPLLVAQSHATYVPLGAPPPAEHLGDAVLFLASDLSASITGTTIHVDGGTWAAGGMLHWPGPRGWAPTPPPIVFSQPQLFGLSLSEQSGG